ncbi:MAG: glycosyltransferase family 2 protein [bacterium]|nr:glycosyltransferase family 2 protein [bacterium]MDA1024367.1 glycosyltransferase family 2 protein [bacterium]
MKPLDLSIIVVTYKEDLHVLRDCFSSVEVSEGINYELIIVDNAGRQETEELAAKYGAIYMPNPENRGFAAAVNQGMKRSDGDYVLLLNPDTSFENDVLARMVAHLNEDHEVGVASCIIRYPDRSFQESIRRFPTFWNQLFIMLKLPHILKRVPAIDHYMMRDIDPMITQDVPSIMGAFMFIRPVLFDRIGYFDERYFIWFEEVDYCKMTHDAGMKIRHYADVEITHHKGHTFNKIATLRKQQWMRTSLRKYIKKHHGEIQWAVLWAFTPLFIVLARIAATIKPK